jgi:predicted small secreted protein
MTQKLRSLLMALFLLAGGTLVLTQVAACNTVEGIGEDTQEAGEAIEDAAD